MGDVDEANSAIGMAVAALRADKAALAQTGWIAALLERVQNDLFDLGADLATPGDDFTPSEMVLRIVPEQVARLETEIDSVTATLAPLRSFILPGGTPAAAALHLARAITRRAERATVEAAAAMPINPQARAYLNRLSDLLFVLSRAANISGAGDILWVPGASRGNPAQERPGD